MEIEGYGSILIRLYEDNAPITVKNFKELIAADFYDGLILHRVERGFCLQGGSPTGDGYGGSDNPIRGEFASNGVPNALPHLRGVVSMARTPNPDSASSQFFILLEDAPHLDGSYAAFGYVVSGMDVVDAIATAKVNSSYKPLTDIVIRSASFLIEN